MSRTGDWNATVPIAPRQVPPRSCSASRNASADSGPGRSRSRSRPDTGPSPRSGHADALKPAARWHAESQIWTAIHASKRRRVRRLRRSPDHRTLHPRRTPDRRPARAAHRPLRSSPGNATAGYCCATDPNTRASPRPRTGQWRGVISVGWETRDPESAHTVRRFAPRCLADLLVKSARTHALRHIHPPTCRSSPRKDPAHRPQGQGRHPAQTHPRMVRSCEEPVSLVPIPGGQHLLLFPALSRGIAPRFDRIIPSTDFLG